MHPDNIFSVKEVHPQQLMRAATNNIHFEPLEYEDHIHDDQVEMCTALGGATKTSSSFYNDSIWQESMKVELNKLVEHCNCQSRAIKWN